MILAGELKFRELRGKHDEFAGGAVREGEREGGMGDNLKYTFDG